VPQLFSRRPELEIKLAASFERLHTVVCISLDVLEELVRSILVRQQQVLDNFKSEDLSLQPALVSEEFLLFGWDLARDHSLTTSLLLVGKLPVLEHLDALFKLALLVARVSCCLLVQSCLSVNDKRQELLSKNILGRRVESIAYVDHTLPFLNTHETLHCKDDERSLSVNVEFGHLIPPFLAFAVDRNFLFLWLFVGGIVD
jgi:hypothetical protein